MLYHLSILLHVLSACIWVGGHLILSIRYLPKALTQKDINIIKGFEQQFEPIGIPALLIQVITGLLMAFHHYRLSFMSFTDQLSTVVSIKLLLLLATILLAIHARFFIIPKLTKEKLPMMAVHILGVTIIGLLMLILGVQFRFGGM